MRWFQTLTAAAVLTFGTAAFVHADPFDLHRVPEDAKWVFHVDVDAVRGSKAWVILDNRLQNAEKFQAGIKMLEYVAGVKFPEGIHDVTLYGREAGEDAVVVVAHADVDKEKILSVLKNNPDYNVDSYRDYEIHSWADKGKRLYGAFYANGLALIGHSAKNIEAALDALDGTHPAVKPESILNAGARPGLLVYAAGQSISELKPSDNNPLLRQMATAWVAISEQDDHLLVKSSVAAKSPAAAKQIRAVLEGVKGWMTLSAGAPNPDPKIKLIAAGLAGVTSKSQDKTISAEGTVPLDWVRSVIAFNDGEPATQPAEPQPKDCSTLIERRPPRRREPLSGSGPWKGRA